MHDELRRMYWKRSSYAGTQEDHTSFSHSMQHPHKHPNVHEDSVDLTTVRTTSTDTVLQHFFFLNVQVI
jgi:hypothetical protein